MQVRAPYALSAPHTASAATACPVSPYGMILLCTDVSPKVCAYGGWRTSCSSGPRATPHHTLCQYHTSHSIRVAPYLTPVAG
eukprot:2516188-Rhodomonas_salina.2